MMPLGVLLGKISKVAFLKIRAKGCIRILRCQNMFLIKRAATASLLPPFTCLILLCCHQTAYPMLHIIIFQPPSTNGPTLSSKEYQGSSELQTCLHGGACTILNQAPRPTPKLTLMGNSCVNHACSPFRIKCWA